ncbi:uncharacterized protein BKA78DRAFT_70241 [Phyllosticta capitalensis]|uniref:uncharacterized protein n=1 Tax=Phyllosticta capitalensis TaxID=121624 RepID=UPI00312DD641
MFKSDRFGRMDVDLSFYAPKTSIVSTARLTQLFNQSPAESPNLDAAKSDFPFVPTLTIVDCFLDTASEALEKLPISKAGADSSNLQELASRFLSAVENSRLICNIQEEFPHSAQYRLQIIRSRKSRLVDDSKHQPGGRNSDRRENGLKTVRHSTHPSRKRGRGSPGSGFADLIPSGCDSGRKLKDSKRVISGSLQVRSWTNFSFLRRSSNLKVAIRMTLVSSLPP